jgi:hypothetical protein
MWKLSGSQCWTLLVEYKFFLWRWPWIALQINKPSWIMKTYVTSKFFLGLLASYQCWNLCMFWLNLHKWRIFLCVIWWHLLNYVKVATIGCIVIRPLNSQHTTFGFQIITKVQACEHPYAMGNWPKFWSSTFGFWGKWPTYLGNALRFGNWLFIIYDRRCFCCCQITSEKIVQR